MKKYSFSLFLFGVLGVLIVIALFASLVNRTKEKADIEVIHIPTVTPTPTKAPSFECKNKKWTIACNKNNDKDIWLCSEAYYCLDEER